MKGIFEKLEPIGILALLWRDFSGKMSIIISIVKWSSLVRKRHYYLREKVDSSSVIHARCENKEEVV